MDIVVLKVLPYYGVLSYDHGGHRFASRVSHSIPILCGLFLQLL